ncbi:MAG TPA: indole-3-glycerol phosphate synthase TrpC [Armatimonadota bacterium]|jgi:indole-3-glycerol phosphate synthase
MTILDDIIDRNRADVAAAKAASNARDMADRAECMPACRPFAPALRHAGRTALIAEVKRASPAKGLLNADFDPIQQAIMYAAAGASAISVLTERHYFQSDPADLVRIRAAVPVPVLRKDFLFDPWQVAESRLMGADAILLIATVLDADALNGMLHEAAAYDLGVLVEAYDESDLERVFATPARVIGINNRNLKTFEVSLENTRRLAAIIRKERPDATIISESGMFSAEDIRAVRSWGADAALVGESLMKAPDVPAKVRELAEA